MAGICLPRSSSAKAISVSQFLENFQRTWSESRLSVAGRRGAECSIPRRLGLAISGGADSMALAYLCSQLKKSQLVNGLSVTAFVVDHKAREESSREANTVAGWLSDIGVKAQILELEWPQTTTTPSKVTAFETHARRLRFQAIGRACRDNNIETLLMGHHQDDNVETTLWRLSSGARGAGLAGIPRVARIPECHGLYGVSESGSSVKLPGRKMGLQINHKGEVQVQDTSSSSTRPETTVSTGGISICRPLLSFPKANLLATCHENQIPFVSDPTNFDPTLTPRNAIRSLLSSNKLPLALQGPSILSLIKSSQNLLKNSNDLSNRLLEKCTLLNLNLNTGSMVIQFPPSPTIAHPSSPSSSSTREKTAEIQALTLRRITELISPYPDNHFSLRNFEPFTHRIFSTAPSTMNMNRQSFTLGGVMFQPLRWKPLSTSSDNIYNNANANVNANANTWLLFRQPFMRHRAPVLRVEVPVPSSSSSPSSRVSSPIYTPWTLWDDRYWFRFTVVPVYGDIPTQDHHERQSISLVLRPLQQSDLTKLRRSFDEMPRNSAADYRALTELMDMLSREAPGQARYTVPVLTMENTSRSEDSLLAVPPMGFRFPETGTQELLQASGWKVQWEWMYKKIDNEPLRLMGWLEDNS